MQKSISRFIYTRIDQKNPVIFQENEQKFVKSVYNYREKIFYHIISN